MSISALIGACQNGDLDLVNHQLQLLQDANDDDELQRVREGKDGGGRSALHWACASGHDSIVERLLKAGWNCNVSDEVGWTPLHSASSAGHLATVRLLLDHDAKINVQNGNGCTPLLYACSKGHRDVIRLLLAHGADASLADRCGSTPLHRVAAAGHLDLVAVLLKNANVNINAVDKSGYSPLHLACMERNKELATELVEHGADPRLKDKEGKVAFYYAPNEQIKFLVSLVTQPEAES